MSDVIKLSLINQALTRTGNNPLSQLQAGTPEGIIALTNYDSIVKETLEEYPFKFALRSTTLSLLGTQAGGPLKYRWQLPPDFIVVRRVEYKATATSDAAIVGDYEIEGDENGGQVLRVAYDARITLLYTRYVSEGAWPQSFQSVIRTRLEAVFRRGINEEVSEGDNDDRRAEFLLKKSRHQRASQVPGKRSNLSGGSLITARRARG